MLLIHSQVFFALRVQYLKRAMAELRELPQSLLQWEVRLLQLACSQTARAALKACDAGVMTASELASARAFLLDVSQVVRSNAITASSCVPLLQLAPDPAMNSARSGSVATAITATLPRLHGFECWLPQGDTSRFAVKSTIMVPELFVDVVPPEQPTNFAELVGLLSTSVQQCDRLISRSYVPVHSPFIFKPLLIVIIDQVFLVGIHLEPHGHEACANLVHASTSDSGAFAQQRGWRVHLAPRCRVSQCSSTIGCTNAAAPAWAALHGSRAIHCVRSGARLNNACSCLTPSWLCVQIYSSCPRNSHGHYVLLARRV